MATYAVGDLQGCLVELLELLEEIEFDAGRDTLWLTGDLVNRGPQSLETLRFVRDLGKRAKTVLGNHDLHLLAVATGQSHRLRRKDTLHDIITAPDRDTLLDWLRKQPVLHTDPSLDFTMVHAGLPPQWDLAQARRHARELENVLRGPDYRDFFRRMYGNAPTLWRKGLSGWDRLRFITNAFTRLRYCNLDGNLDLEDKGPPGQQRPGNFPWFAVPNRKSVGERILFGHWSTLQLHGQVHRIHRVFPLDNGCVWGGRLTALRLDDEVYFHHRCRVYSQPRSPRVGIR